MKKTAYILLIISLLFNASCVKDLTELNKDPNNSTEVEPNLLFKYSIKRGMGGYLTASHLEYTGLQQWVMYLATRGGVEPGNEYPSPAGGDGFWNESYIDAMNNAQVVIRIAEGDAEMANMKAAAIIWKTYQMHRITDLWGNVPYSDALQGNPDLVLYPKYDLQENIYAQMLNDLELAVGLFDESKDFFTAEDDLLLAGDINAWIRFANSLRLRLAIRISKVNPEWARTVLDEIKDLPMINSNGDIVGFQFNSVYNKPLFEAGSIRYGEGAQYINPSKFLADVLVENNDPRTPFILNKTVLSETFPFIDEYRGVPNLLAYNSEEWEKYNLDAALGDPLGQWGDVSRMSDWYLNNDRPMPLFTYSEVCYLKAEAALLGFIPGSEQELFAAGIKAHMDYMNEYVGDYPPISDFIIDNFINSLGEVTLEKVITQKWLLFVYENVFEAYADYRRTGFPQLLDYDGEVIDEESFPKRLRYPYSEYTLNRDNYLNAIEIQGPDTDQTKIWWNHVN